jgi:hypothetical protein
MNLLRRFVGLAVFATANLLLSEQLLAQTVDATATVQATIQFSNGQSVTVTDFSNQIGVQPNDFVNITIQFGAHAIGQPVIVEALDGGPVSTGSSIRVVEADGSLSLAFLAAANPGPKSNWHSGRSGNFPPAILGARPRKSTEQSSGNHGGQSRLKASNCL